MNYVTSLQIYVRDNSYFDNYDLVKYSIYRPFRDREDIKKILEKIEKGDGISEDEKEILVRSFRKGGLDYDMKGYGFTINLSDVDNIKNLNLFDIWYFTFKN
jgi:hypothetical protein